MNIINTSVKISQVSTTYTLIKLQLIHTVFESGTVCRLHALPVVSILCMVGEHGCNKYILPLLAICSSRLLSVSYTMFFHYA